MNLTISPQIRIVALVGLVAALGGVASMLMLGRSGTKTDTSAAAPTRAAHTVPTKTVPAKTVPAKTVPAKAVPAKAHTTHAAVAPATHHTTPRTATHVKHA